jgi:hypothetical protein
VSSAALTHTAHSYSCLSLYYNFRSQKSPNPSHQKRKKEKFSKPVLFNEHGFHHLRRTQLSRLSLPSRIRYVIFNFIITHSFTFSALILSLIFFGQPNVKGLDFIRILNIQCFQFIQANGYDVVATELGFSHCC